MKIVIFEVEEWERQAFDKLKGEHQFEFTVENIAAYARGQPQNVVVEGD